MRRWLLLCLAAWPLPATAARAPQLELPGYQAESGAIALSRDGSRVDPYFATKALLVARAAGLEVRPAARRWIGWLLPRQDPAGLFGRYCLEGGAYVACAPADADDSMLALWMELLVTVAPPGGLPAAWARSLNRAARALDALRDPATGVYRISSAMPVSLLMDNVEVHGAFLALSRHHAGAGDPARARAWRQAAARLRRDLVAVFWDPALRTFRVTTQARTQHEFYPDAVAQIFALAGGFPGEDRAGAYARWMERHRDAWARGAGEDYPWGLIALAAREAGDRPAVRCWRARAAPLRHGDHWNVLEEAVYQALEAEVRPGEERAACSL